MVQFAIEMRPSARLHVVRMPSLRPWFGISLASLLLACSGDSPPEARALHGTLERDRFDLVASASEPIAGIDVTKGERVEAGQVLVRLDDRRQLARIEAARALVHRQAARVAELERGGRSERREEAAAQIAVLESELDQARIDLGRIQRLVTDRISSQSELDEAETRVEGAEARLVASRAIDRELRVGATDEELAQARADLASAEATVIDREVDVDRMTVRAPVAGTIEALPYEVGELPGAGATVAILAADTAPWVRVYLPESELAATSLRTPARVQAGAEGPSLPACVRFVSREATFTPYYSLTEHDRHHLAFLVEVELLDETGLDLPTGVPVQVWIGDAEAQANAETCQR